MHSITETLRMALTSKHAQEIQENVHTDVGAQAEMFPRSRRRLSPEAAIILDKSIVARPLSNPQVADVRIKNTDFYYRWVNRESHNGMMYQRRKLQGFVNATTDDVDLLTGNAVQDSGELRAGDLVLMKLPIEVWKQAVKYNAQKAYSLARSRGLYFEQKPSTDPFDNTAASRKTVNSDPFSRGKVQPFIPSDAEVEAMVSDSIRTGRADEARRAVEEMRRDTGRT